MQTIRPMEWATEQKARQITEMADKINLANEKMGILIRYMRNDGFCEANDADVDLVTAMLLEIKAALEAGFEEEGASAAQAGPAEKESWTLN